MKMIRISLQIVGAGYRALCLVILIITGIWIELHSASSSNDIFNKNNAVFILNWAGIDQNQDWEIVESLVSARNITGDHIDYYCIQLQHFDVEKSTLEEEWRQGPENDALLAVTVEKAAQWARYKGSKCFPTPEVANSAKMKIMFWSVTTHGRRPAAAKVILYQPELKRLYYVSYST